MVFHDIDSVDWKGLRQAHGYAGHVPNAIKGLISDDQGVQEASYWKLDNYIVLQGDLYQAAFYVIPFLIRILKCRIQNGRNYVYDLLLEIANGYAPDEILCIYDGSELLLTDACKKSIADNIDVFLREVADISSSYRESALNILISLEYYREEVIFGLSNIIDKEDDSEFRRKLQEAIAEIR